MIYPIFILLTTIASLTDPFAPNELNPDQLFMVEEVPLAGSGSNYNQAIHLERGWNLVSWYVELPDETEWSELMMDDVFRQPPAQQGQPYGNYFWLNPILDPQNPGSGDRVGKHDGDPFALPINELYPLPGTSNWTWSMSQAYHIYRDRFDADSPPHFWEYTNQPHFSEPTGTLTIDPSAAWDDYLAPTTPPNFWWFLAYPLRMEQKIDTDEDPYSEIPTIAALENYSANRLLVLKDDEKHQYVPGNRRNTNLYYLTPGHGYFAGFANTTNDPTCPGFSDQIAQEPASLPGGGSKNDIGSDPQTASLETSHFTYTERTHWWYPIVIDTAAIGSIAQGSGDEIAVFDGDLCVGAAAYPDSFPVIFGAWMDDIATPSIVDGYIPGHQMIFKWFDQSANQEITFVPPPGSYSAEDDRIAPTHSGFGYGFYAVRSLTDGIGSVQQLPQAFKLGQNFPNPFNAETVIPLELPQRSHVRIELYNVRGQNLGIIYEGIKNAGWDKIRWNARSLPSGIYFYRVEAAGLERGGKFGAAGKMLLLK